MNVLILGPQGSGKGTQAKRIADEYGLAHFSTGDMLRAAIANGTPLGRRFEPLIESGKLVPDAMMIELIQEVLGASEAAEGFILDGFPRTLPQAEALDMTLKQVGRALDVVLELQLDDQTCFERMLGRAQAEGRKDDTPEVIRRRLDIYHRQTEPVVEHYRATGRLVGIHGERSVNEVFAEIQSAIEQAAAR